MSKLLNKVAVITGGSSGIGLATAKRFVAEGAYVFITGRRQSELDKAKAVIGKNVTAIQGDIANLTDLDRVYKTVKEQKGGLDVVIANAGFVETRTLATATPEHFDKTFNTNARGTFFTVQKALPLLRDGGSVVLVASCVIHMGIPFYTTYSATKAALRSFSMTWASDLKDRRIRVNTLSPGATDTPIIDGQFATRAEADEAKKGFSSQTPLGRIGRPEEIAAAALFLASDESSFTTGSEVVVDGGLSQV